MSSYEEFFYKNLVFQEAPNTIIIFYFIVWSLLGLGTPRPCSDIYKNSRIYLYYYGSNAPAGPELVDTLYLFIYW